MKKYFASFISLWLITIVFFVLLPNRQVAYAVKAGGVCSGPGAPGNCDAGLICHAPNFNDPSVESECLKSHGQATVCHNTCGVPSTNEVCTSPKNGIGQGNCGTGLVCMSPQSNPDLDKLCLSTHGQSPLCQSHCQLRVAPGSACVGSGQGNCQDGSTCNNGMCQSTNVQEGGKCIGTGQGNCADSLVCFDKKCITPDQNNDHCRLDLNNTDVQGSCAKGLKCQFANGSDPNGTNGPGGGCDLHTGQGCGGVQQGNIVGGGTCIDPTKKAYEPPTLPPPPSPPCRTWSNNGVCNMFGSSFGGFATNPNGFIEKVFAILLSVSGGLASLLIIRAGYEMMTAQGNPEKLNNAREQLVAAIVGLVFLIFSFVFLQLIGFDILQLPGFKP